MLVSELLKHHHRYSPIHRVKAVETNSIPGFSTLYFHHRFRICEKCGDIENLVGQWTGESFNSLLGTMTWPDGVIDLLDGTGKKLIPPELEFVEE